MLKLLKTFRILSKEFLLGIAAYANCVDVSAGQFWFTGKYVYVRIKLTLKDGELLYTKVITVRFTRNGAGIALVNSDYDPRKEI